MPTRLERYYNLKHLHFITCSGYHRLPRLASPRRRDLFLRVLEQARRRYRFVVVGYVVMPEHIHLLISEPEIGDPSVVMKVVKQRFARMLRGRRACPAQWRLWPDDISDKVWQKRFYDFNVWTERKQIEKLRYIHRNPGGWPTHSRSLRMSGVAVLRASPVSALHSSQPGDPRTSQRTGSMGVEQLSGLCVWRAWNRAG